MSDESTTQPTQQPPTQNTETAPESIAGDSDSAYTRTQEEFDVKIKPRLERHKEKALSDLFEELGVKSKSDIKAMLDAERKRKDDELSEIEKLQREIESLKTAKLEAENRTKEIETARVRDQQQIALRNALQAMNAKDMDNLLILVNAKHKDSIPSVFAEDNPTHADEKRMEALTKQIANDFPVYFGSSGAGSPSNAGGTSPLTYERAQKEAQTEIQKKFGHL